MNHMEKLREILGRIESAITRDETLLRRARKRRQKFAERAARNHDAGVAAAKSAERLRREGNVEKAMQRERKADRCHARAFRSSQKAQWWIGRVKHIQQRRRGLEIRTLEVHHELKKLERKEVRINVDKNTVRGGTPRDRVVAAALLSASRCASGKRLNFYSMPGGFTTDACFTGEKPGERSDCSQWIASVYVACDLPIPGTWTGDMVTKGRQVSVNDIKPGDLVIYGPGSGFHVELYVGPGNKTIGHGTAPIDPGVIDLFGDGNYRVFRYI